MGEYIKLGFTKDPSKKNKILCLSMKEIF